MAEGGHMCIFRSPKLLNKFVMGTSQKFKKKWVDMLNHGRNSDNFDDQSSQ